MNQNPILTLVGAGPGDPELITLKAIKALKSADLVLYDALIDPSLLHYCRSSCVKKFVGKRAGAHSHTQQEICDIITAASFQYKQVVRLKGGDAFIFGRATEEIMAARAAGMTVEVIQGVSSALAVPAAAMIPLTSRGISESFWVVTGTTRKGGFSTDIYLAAQSTATIVLLMAINQLQAIMNIFMQYGKENTPVAIIQEGCTIRQKMITGKVGNIAALAKEKQITNPAVVVVGSVVLSQQQMGSVINFRAAI